MGKRIFLDVGANTGQTLLAALDPVFRFDEIYCFEPSQYPLKKLRDIAGHDKRVHLCYYGLWDKGCKVELFDPGSKGGSVYPKDNMRQDPRAPEVCEFLQASLWFSMHIHEGDTVFLKLNVEGAECDIMDDLLDSGEFNKVTYAMIDFDVRKIASQKHRQAEIMARLNEAGIGYPRVAFTKQVMVGATHQDRIKHWLRAVGADQ